MSAQDLSALLWQERELLELLAFKLEEEQLLLTSGKTRWLHHATREVEQVLQKLRDTGLARAVHASAVATEWGIDDGASLRELTAAAPAGPWGELLSAHLQAMTALVSQIAGLRDSNQQFLKAASRSTQETLAGIGTGAGTYASDGAAWHGTDRPTLLDKDL
ncbi:flagellar protein FlgN [Arthrobacter agilis]|uniref:flagellar protein FlgN n=1 Tax=Arthrobacter agilis TaxID=37921 RepID=UPI000B354E6E|nr:flagellar protein FlgN [Arthrobacter agilis]OUM43727.1 flagellar biosynthesis protein FlgN [Arthrobacter agilis]PPB46688.1 flagellar protein FlgN [Arthrobacter agilis]TPV24969.1 flagellar protein FlgN [Arthrobacter agilis]WDF33753.1 flagellar protein FlgN [Arthrobacter agilis]VDR31144.1 FlgN protein [Arthrobacter agilis]